MTPSLSETVVIEVPFHDVDAMGVAWHGHYVKYLEIARTAMMRKIGLDYEQLKASGCVWPIAECHLKYIRPLRYGMKVRVQATLVECETRVKVAYLLTDDATGERLNRAWTTQVAVRADTGELEFAMPSHLFTQATQA
ncbi:MAG: acyl-CoA thioesterase [Firmicutes bacterium]|nr:acyl-CoA thioesterase [Bacillota bacterium]